MRVNSFINAAGDSWQDFKGGARVTRNVGVITWCLGRLLKPQRVWQRCLFLRLWKKEQESAHPHVQNSYSTRAKCWLSLAGVVSGQVGCRSFLLRLVLRSLCGIGGSSAEAPLPPQNSDMSLWWTCEQQADSFFFESSVLGCDTFDKSGGEDPTHASPGCHHRGFVAALNRRRRRPSFSAGRFCRNHTSTWEMTSVGSFTPKQIRRRCVILMFLTLLPKSFPRFLHICLFCYTTVWARKREYYSKNSIPLWRCHRIPPLSASFLNYFVAYCAINGFCRQTNSITQCRNAVILTWKCK